MFMRKTLVFLVLVVGLLHSHAQDLATLPPVLLQGKLTDTTSCLLFSEMDMHYYNDQGPQRYNHAVEIVDAAHPWPPRWYTSVPIYTDSMTRKDTIDGMVTQYYIFDACVEGGNLCFFKAMSRVPKSVGERTIPGSGYIRLKKNLLPRDTIKSTIDRLVYFHEMRVNDKEEIMMDVKQWANLDLRKVTGEAKDSAVPSEYDLIQIYDKRQKLLYSWNPLDHLNPDVFDYKASLKHTFSSPDYGIDWSHITTSCFDLDGNILYSMRFIGIGKVSRKDGSLIWHHEWSDMPIINGKDTIRIFSPHDMRPISEDDTSNVYSVYSCGQNPEYPVAEAVVFRVHKKTHKITLVKNYRPEERIMSGGQGSFDLEANGDYIMNYGQAPNPVGSNNYRPFMQVGRGDSVFARYSLPKWVVCYRVHKLRNWPKPPRPEIVLKNGVLLATGDF